VVRARYLTGYAEDQTLTPNGTDAPPLAGRSPRRTRSRPSFPFGLAPNERPLGSGLIWRMPESLDARGEVSAMDHDEIRLAVPAAPEYARIARLAVAGLATRLGFSYDEVEDLRIAVGEACSVLMAEGPIGRIEIVYRLENDAMEVEATADAAVARRANGTSLSEQILSAVVDEHRIDPMAGRVWLRKQRSDG